MKWFKRILLMVVALFVLVIGTGVVGFYMYRQAPSWYKPRAASAAEQKEAAGRADQKFADVFSWAAAVQAREIRLNLPGKHDEPRIGPKTLVLTEDEINSFFERNWENSSFAWEQDLKRKLSAHFSEGRVVLLDDQIVLAGQSKDLGTLVSLPVSPMIDEQGQLWLRMQTARAGMLPLPAGLLVKQMGQMRAILSGQLQNYQDGATLDDTYTANGAAVGAAMTRMLLEMLDGKPSDPLVFIPYDLKNWQRMVVVRLTAISVKEGSLTLTLDAWPDGQQKEVLVRIRRPYAGDGGQ